MADDDSPPSPAALVGRSIAGRFVVESLIATGGAGSVYRARQLALDRTVALKVLRPDIARDRHFVERFKREARAASRLDHPNSVRVFDFGHVDASLLYLAMELVEGRTLHQVIQEEWPLGDRRVVDIMSQVLSAIAVAHEMEVIHRDLKPDNIMIIPATSDDGDAMELAKVCDFGIATLGAAPRDGDGSGPAGGPWTTMDGSLVGTPGYMSPEQARGEAADRRSDIYSAGVILYHLLAGRPPFDGENAYFVAMKQISDTPPLPSVHAAVNAELEAVCLRAINKAPGDRYDSAREMRSALRAALARSTPAGQLAAARGAAIEVTPTPRMPLGQTRAPRTIELMEAAGIGRAARRRRVAAAVAITAAVAIGAAALTARSMRAGGSPPAHAPAIAAQATAPPPAAAPPAPQTPLPNPLPASRGEGIRGRPTPPAAPSARAKRTRDRSPVRAGAVEARPAPEQPPAVPAYATAAPTPAPIEERKAEGATPAPAPPSPPRIDIERATASITAISATSAIPSANVRSALGRLPLVRCYRDALRAGGLASGTATLHLRIDGGGYVTGAALQGAGITPALKGCLEKAATGVRIKDVDTGEATADVTVSFVAAP